MADPAPPPPPPSAVYLLKKYMLLLATLVATVTYGAGLNLPGGSWLADTPDGQHAGDSILRHTDFMRYIVFYYFNAISFAASLLVGLLLLVMQRDASMGYVILMWTMMGVDALGLIGAYAAGISHDKFTTICASVLVPGVAVYAAFAFACYVKNHRHHLFPQHQYTSSSSSPPGNTSGNRAETPPPTPTEKHEMLLVLAIFAVTGAYVAGLNPPGGFWRSTEEGHHNAGDPVLQRLHPNRYKAFFLCNTTAFVTSLLAITLTLDYERLNLDKNMTGNVRALYGLIITSLGSLGGAYAAGSCRDGKHTGLVVSLVVLVVVCVCVVHALHRIISINIKGRLPKFISAIHNAWKNKNVRPVKVYGKLDEYIQLLATLGATITYLAGLDPPGGVWASSGEDHSVGDPILLTTYPVRYKFFFYFNSGAFVASLVIVVMVQKTGLARRGHALLVALILDFFGLIGAYAAGSCRDTSTTIYTVAIAGAVLIYVVIHIVFFTLDNGNDNNEEELERKRELLLLLAILAATLAYQVGFTPPGGLWEDDDKFGHRAGFPVLQDKYHRRYKAFFYCNAASFMASAALIVLLLNQNMYKPGIRCYALYVCMAAGMFGLMGAYAAGSSLHLKTSIIFLVSVGVGFGIATYLAVARYLTAKEDDVETQRKNEESSKVEHNNIQHEDEESAENLQQPIEKDDDRMASYLMLVAILAASVTYIAGLKPPGGMWREDGDGHSAGNPVLHDIDKRRYNVFFYSNSASFVASIVVIALLLSRMMLPKTVVEKFIRSLLHTPRPLQLVHTAVVLDVLALLVAYAAGTSRESLRSWKVIMLLPIEVFVVFLFSFISLIRNAYCSK